MALSEIVGTPGINPSAEGPPAPRKPVPSTAGRVQYPSARAPRGVRWAATTGSPTAHSPSETDDSDQPICPSPMVCAHPARPRLRPKRGTPTPEPHRCGSYALALPNHRGVWMLAYWIDAHEPLTLPGVHRRLGCLQRIFRGRVHGYDRLTLHLCTRLDRQYQGW